MTTNLIPRVIYQTWKSTDFPAGMQEAVDSWRTQNPDYQYEFFDDARMKDYVYNFDCTDFPFTNEQLRTAFDSIRTGAGRADIWRYLIIYDHGGIYADIDTVCVKPLDTLLGDNTCHVHTGIFGKFQASPDPRWFFTTFLQFCLIYSPRNPIIKRLIEKVIECVLTRTPIEGSDNWPLELERYTGACILNWIVRDIFNLTLETERTDLTEGIHTVTAYGTELKINITGGGPELRYNDTIKFKYDGHLAEVGEDYWRYEPLFVDEPAPATNDIDYAVVHINNRAEWNIMHLRKVIRGRYHDLEYFNGHTTDVYQFFKDRNLEFNWQWISNRGLGELGCIASNILLMEYIVENNIDNILVLEDDTEIDANFVEEFSKCVAELPEDFDFLSCMTNNAEWMLYAIGDKSNVEIGSELIVRSYFTMSPTNSMYYSKRGVEKILNYYQQYGIIAPLDSFIFSLSRHKMINGYNLKNKILVEHNRYPSTINDQDPGTSTWEGLVRYEEYFTSKNTNPDKGFPFTQAVLDYKRSQEKISKFQEHKNRIANKRTG